MGAVEHSNALITQIGQVLWRVMPWRCSSYVCVGQVLDGFAQTSLYWVNKRGVKQSYAFKDYPEEASLAVGDLVTKMAATDLYAQDPFTHFTITLDSSGRINADFAYIEPDDCWPDLFMRGVSDLTEAEAEALGVSPEHWRARCAMASN